MFSRVFAPFFLTALALSARADMHVEADPTGNAWIFPEELTVTDASRAPLLTKPKWIVSCPAPRSCFARSGPVILIVDPDNAPRLFLDPRPLGEVALMLADYAYELEPMLGEALPVLWEARLVREEATLLFERGDAVSEERSIAGLGVALAHLRQTAGLPPSRAKGQISHLRAMQFSDTKSREGGGRLIPDTKPQIEFAIRAQIEDFPPSGSSPAN